LEPFPPELPASPVEPGEPGNPYVKDETIILIYITQDNLKHNLTIGLTVMIHGYSQMSGRQIVLVTHVPRLQGLIPVLTPDILSPPLSFFLG